MNMKLKVTHFLGLVLSVTATANAQQGFVAMGGDISQSNGSIASSIGQLVYTWQTSEAGDINQGLQQPFSFTLVSTQSFDRDTWIQPYPNPASHQIFLELPATKYDTHDSKLSARIYDLRGNLCITQVVRDHITLIPIHTLPAATYFLQVWNETSLLRSFTFSKTN
jgi:hypothetical protein